jgi:hypothetical protein
VLIVVRGIEAIHIANKLGMLERRAIAVGSLCKTKTNPLLQTSASMSWKTGRTTNEYRRFDGGEE